MNCKNQIDCNALASNRCSICMRGISGKSSKCKQYDENEDSEQDFKEDNKKESNRLSCKECGLSIHKACGAKYFTNIKSSTKKWICDYCSYLQSEGKAKAKFMKRPVCSLCETDHPSLMMKEIKANMQFGGRRDDMFSKQFVHIACTEWYTYLRLNNMEQQNKGEFIIFNCDPKIFDRSQIKKESMLSQCAECVGKSKNKILIPCIFNEYFCKSYFHMSCLINKNHLKGTILVAAQLKTAFKVLVICPFCAERMTNTILGIKSSSKSKLSNDILTVVKEFVKKNFVLIQPSRIIEKNNLSVAWARYFPEECNQNFNTLKFQKYAAETEELKKIRDKDSPLYSVLNKSPKKKIKKDSEYKEIEPELKPKHRPATIEEILIERGIQVKKMLKDCKWIYDPDFKPEYSKCIICYRPICEVNTESDIPLFCEKFCGQLMHAYCYYGTSFHENLILESNKHEVEEFSEIIHCWTCELCTELQKLPFANKIDYSLIKKFDGGDYYSKIPHCKMCSNKGGPLRKFESEDGEIEWYHSYCIILTNKNYKDFSWKQLKSCENIKQSGSCYDCMKKGVVIKCFDKQCKKSFHIPCCLNLTCKFTISQFNSNIKAFCEEHSNIRKRSPTRHTSRNIAQQSCGKEPRMLSQIEISTKNSIKKATSSSALQIDDGENELEYLKDKDFFRINWNSYNDYFEPITDEVFSQYQCYIPKEINFAKLIATINEYQKKSLENLKSNNKNQKERFRVLFEINSKANAIVSNSNIDKKYILAQYCESKSSQSRKIKNDSSFSDSLNLLNPFMSELNLAGFDSSSIQNKSKKKRNFELECFFEKSKKQVENIKKYNNMLIQAEVNFMINPAFNYSQSLVEDQVSHYIYGLSVELNSIAKELNTDLKDFYNVCDIQRKIENKTDLIHIQEECRIIDYALQQVTAWKKLRANMLQGINMQGENNSSDRCCQVCFLKDDNNFNQIVYCRQCNKGAHQFCYGFHRINTVFVCDECQYIKENESKLEEQKEILAIAFGVLKPNNLDNYEKLCIICKKEGGMLKMIHRELKDKRRFVHIFCCITSGLYFNHITTFQNLEQGVLFEIESTKSVQKCEVCLSSKGYTVDLISPSTQQPLLQNVHTYCAWLAGYKFNCSIGSPSSVLQSKYHQSFPMSTQIYNDILSDQKFHRHLSLCSQAPSRRKSSSLDTTCTLKSS